MLIVPALLEKTPEELFAQINRLAPYFSRFQIDIQDGLFVHNKTLSLDSLSEALIRHPSSRFRDLIFDFHLMVQDYEKEIQGIERLKQFMPVKTILIPLSSNHSRLSFGLVLNPEETVEALATAHNMKIIPAIQIMSIYPGPQGQQFIPKTLQKIEQLKKLNYRGEILLDGGINETTIPHIRSLPNQPDVLCVGSYLTKTINLQDKLKYLFEKCGFEAYDGRGNQLLRQ